MKEKVYVSNGNIMYIYRIMKKYTDAEHPLNVNEIIKLIKEEYGEEISNRTIRRNFKVLEQKFNISIERVDNAYYMDYEDDDFDSSEIRCIVDMVNYSRFVDENTAKILSSKLVNLLNENDKLEFEDYEKYMKDSRTINKQVFYTTKIIAEAIRNENFITFEYYKYNLKKEHEYRKSFNISPVTIICEIGEYYLIATDETKELRYYRLDRMKNVTIDEKKAINIPKKQLKDYIESSIGMFGGKKELVKAIVSNKLIDDVIESFGKDVKINQYNKDNFKLETEVNIIGFKNWALRHLEDAKVIYPEELKKGIIRILNDSINKYV